MWQLFQARSQDLEKGGLFWKSEKCANDLDSNFHWSWISFRRFVRKLTRNVSESSEIQRFFPPKIRRSPKKKGLRQNSEWFFGRNPKFKGFFLPKLDDFQKKKKKVFAKIQIDFSSNFANSDVWGGALFVWGGYFPFFTENRPQKHKKHAILHTSLANRGARAPPAPPWLRYWALSLFMFLISFGMLRLALFLNFEQNEPCSYKIVLTQKVICAVYFTWNEMF